MKYAVWGAAALAMCATAANAGTATRAPFGALSDGTKVESVTLTNGAGIAAKIMTLGATLQSLTVPDKAGHKDDVVLGYDIAQEYLAHPDYFGASVGRYANRIAKAKFTIDGKIYTLATNDGPNSLHGGTHGFRQTDVEDQFAIQWAGRQSRVQLCQRRWRRRLSRRTESHRRPIR